MNPDNEKLSDCHNYVTDSTNPDEIKCCCCGKICTWHPSDKTTEQVSADLVSEEVAPTEPPKSKRKKTKRRKQRKAQTKDTKLGGEKLAKSREEKEEEEIDKQNQEIAPLPEILDKDDTHDEDEDRPLNPRQELFARLYSTTREFFGNGVQSYIEAYNPDISKPNWYNTAKANAHESLTKPYILKRIRELMDIFINDEVVDKELSSVILQSADLGAKVSAIKEYNQLKSRVKNKLEIEDTRETTKLRNKLFGIMDEWTNDEDTDKGISDGGAS